MFRTLTCRRLFGLVVLFIVMMVILLIVVFQEESGKSLFIRVIIDKDGFVRVNGRWWYFYGVFCDPLDLIIEFIGLKQVRFDLIYEYLFEVQINGDVVKWICWVWTYLWGVAEQGIGVVLGLLWDVVEDLGDVLMVCKLVEVVKDELVLWFWYFLDEFGCCWELKKVVANLNKVYWMIKKVDFNYLVVICGIWVEFFFVNNVDNVDIFWFNIYFVFDGFWVWTMSETKGYSQWWLTKLVWSVSQVFDWWIGDRCNVIIDKMYWSNVKEIRVQVHVNIVVGVRSSVFYWLFKWVELFYYDICKLFSIWGAVCDLGDELKVFELVLLFFVPKKIQVVMVRFEWTVKEVGCIWDDVYYWQRWYNGNFYVGVVNVGHEWWMKVIVELFILF